MRGCRPASFGNSGNAKETAEVVTVCDYGGSPAVALYEGYIRESAVALAPTAYVAFIARRRCRITALIQQWTIDDK